MGWSVGFDTHWQRDIGYGVPAHCDHPDCGAEIDRGLAHVCGGAPFGGDTGCGLYFCVDHLWLDLEGIQRCAPCNRGLEPFTPTPDTPAWISWKLTDSSWARWRAENPDQARQLSDTLTASGTTTQPKGTRNHER